jgi:lipopolysaccharide/colanic/teichoic acid biosynthesis glycosyltransferase
MYAKYIKRLLDFILSLCAFILLLPLMIVLTIIGAIFMKGNPFYVQPRPGKNERIFRLIKFRTMSCEKDENGNLLPDEKRLTKYGKFLRSTSLDELPELINIIKGDMAIVGPRPQLVRDMVFMSKHQRKRHSVRPGLTGLAQVSGRNNITWEEKFEFDLKYIANVTFWNDLKIIFKTFIKVIRRSDTIRKGTVSDVDLGDWLVQGGKVSMDEYEEKQEKAKELLKVQNE